MWRKLAIPFEPIEDLSCYKKVSCNFTATSVKQLLSHYRVSHSKDKDSFSSPCLYSKRCAHTTPFRSFSGLYSHLKNFHRKFFEPSSELDGEIEPILDNGNEPAVSEKGNDIILKCSEYKDK